MTEIKTQLLAMNFRIVKAAFEDAEKGFNNIREMVADEKEPPKRFKLETNKLAEILVNVASKLKK